MNTKNTNVKKTFEEKEWEQNKDLYYQILGERRDILKNVIEKTEYKNLEELFSDVNYALYRTDASYIIWTSEMKNKLNKLYNRDSEYENRYENVKKRLTQFYKNYKLSQAENKNSYILPKSSAIQNKFQEFYKQPVAVYGGKKYNKKSTS